MVLIKIETQYAKKRTKKRDRIFFRFLALMLFLTIWPLEKGGAISLPPPPIPKKAN
jgi:hypothetical protein